MQRRKTTATETKFGRKVTINSPSHHRLPRLSSKDFENRQPTHNSIKPLYSIPDNSLSQFFINTLDKLKGRAIMYLGLMLEAPALRPILEILVQNASEVIQELEDIDERQSANIYFLTESAYEFQDCKVIVLIYPTSQLRDGPLKHEINALSTFLIFPQILIMDSQALRFPKLGQGISQTEAIQSALNAYMVLGSNQRIILTHFNPDQDLFVTAGQLSKKAEIVPLNVLSPETLDEQLWMTLKRNTVRCMNQSFKINLHLLVNLLTTKAHPHFPSNSSPQQGLVNQATTSYLEDQVRFYFQDLQQHVCAYKIPMQEEKLNGLLENMSEQKLENLRINLKVLRIFPEQALEIESEAEANIQFFKSSIIDQNRQAAAKANSKLIEQLSKKLIEGCEGKKYSKIKDKKQMLAEDLRRMMDDYDSRSIEFRPSLSHSQTESSERGFEGGAFSTFNGFLAQNKDKYFRLISELNDELLHDHKGVNEIHTKIEMKKRMLGALEKEVRQLEERKGCIEVQSDSLKKRSENMHDKVKFQFGNSEKGENELKEADSIKSFGYGRFQSSKESEKMERQQVSSNKSEKDQQVKPGPKTLSGNRKVGKNRKFLCCNCLLF